MQAAAAATTLRVHSSAIPQVMGRPALVPVRLSGDEGINSLFEYELLLKTPEDLLGAASGGADFNLDDFAGREISCTIELDGSGTFAPGATGIPAGQLGAGTREINALICRAQFWGEEGRHLQYKLTLRPWLYLATLTTDCKVFQNKTVVEILDEVLADYAFPVDKRLAERYARRDYQVQYNESDLAFVERLCQEWGINYFFEHSQGKHRLVLADHMGAWQPNPSEAYRQVPYHPPGHKIDTEYLHAWAPTHRLASGRYSSTDYDYTEPRADLRQSMLDARPTAHADGEVYEWHASHGASHWAQPKAGSADDSSGGPEQGRLLALLRMQQLRTGAVRAQGSGNVRGMVPGCTFKLVGHPRQSANAEYLVLDTRLVVEEVGENTQAAGAALRQQKWRVLVDLQAHPSGEALRPTFTRAKPHTHGPQTALVVGPQGQNLWTDALGRIKVQFPWDRLGQKNEHSSCWVRVSNAWAGNQLGAMHIPRIGQEVIIDFIGGDPDLPICTGRVFNQVNLPPWKLPDQSALSGLRSRELNEGGGNGAAGRSNHLVMDDTPGQIQVQLKSDHHHSSLSLGYMFRIDGNAGRQDARGQGFELRTDGWGAVRANHGLLLSTQGRPKAQAHVTDMGETIDRLDEGERLHDSLSSAAQQAQAQDAADQAQSARALKDQNHELRGTGKQAQPERGDFPELDEPHLVLASAAGMAATSAASTHWHAGEHLALSSGQHTSLSSAQSLLASARKAIRLFSYQAGIRMVAYGGDVEIKALKHNMLLMAQLQITQTADTIQITARQELKLNGGGSCITLNAGGIEERTPGPHLVHAKTHLTTGPLSAPTPLAAAAAQLPDTPAARSIVLRAHPEDGRVLAMEPYTLMRDGAQIQRGVTDAQGRIQIPDHLAGTKGYTAKLANGHEIDLPVVAQLADEDAVLAARGYRAQEASKKKRRAQYLQQQGRGKEV